MDAATLYSTWKQAKPGLAPVYLMVIVKWIAEDKVKKYTVLNMDGSLETIDIEEKKFGELVEKKIFQPWRP